MAIALQNQRTNTKVYQFVLQQWLENDDTDKLSLLALDSIKATSLRISLSALLLRA